VIFLGGGLVWLATLARWRMVGLSSLTMGASFPLFALWRREPGEGYEVVLGAFALTLLVFVRHRANMARMRAGTEPRIGGARSAREE